MKNDIKKTTIKVCIAFNRPDLCKAVEQGTPCSTALRSLAQTQTDYKIPLEFLALEAKRCEDMEVIIASFKTSPRGY